MASPRPPRWRTSWCSKGFRSGPRIRLVGDAVRRAVEAGSTELADFGPPGWLDGIDRHAIEVAGLLETQAYGGGPGAFAGIFDSALARWQAHRDWHAGLRRLAAEADRELRCRAEQLIAKQFAGGPANRPPAGPDEPALARSCSRATPPEPAGCSASAARQLQPAAGRASSAIRPAIPTWPRTDRGPDGRYQRPDRGARHRALADRSDRRGHQQLRVLHRSGQ